MEGIRVMKNWWSDGEIGKNGDDVRDGARIRLKGVCGGMKVVN